MNLSIIIPSFNGAKKLPCLFESLQSQSAFIKEIILFIDGSTDNSAEIAQIYSDKLEVIIRHSSNVGRAKARNISTSSAAGDLLLFLDDDVAAGSETVLRHINHHKDLSNSILCGKILDSSVKSDIQLFKAYKSKVWSKKYDVSSVTRILIPALSAANFSISRDLFMKLGGFDERLTDAEDFDLAVRAMESGIPIYYSSEAIAYHNDNITGLSYLKRLREYREAHKKLRALEPSRYANLQINNPLPPKGLKGSIFKFFAQSFWIKWLDSDLLKSWIPRSVRFKLYDLILTANGTYFPEKVRL